MKTIHRCILWPLLLVSSITITAQTVIEENFIEALSINAKPFFDETNAAFNALAPDKWKNESAVIIGYKRSITFDKKNSTGFFSGNKAFVYLYETVRFKIKLQDKNAVQKFTEVYFRFGEKEDGFVAQLTKHDGSKQGVDISDAVAVESKSDVPEFYKSFFDQNSASETRYYKVAVPNLEVGDILEYVAYTKSKLNVKNTGLVEFDPQYELCSKDYPLLLNEISIDTDDKTFFKSLSINGAPEFRKENSDVAGFFRYVFTDKDRATIKDVNFISPYLVNPLVKFQVIYANTQKLQSTLGFEEKGELKVGFTKEDLAKYAWTQYSYGRYAIIHNSGVTADMFITYTYIQLKKEKIVNLPEEKYVENIYYRIRNQGLFRNNYLPDATFAYIFRSLLTMRKIESDLVITVSNNHGSIKDVLFDSEIRYAVRLKDKFIYNCTDHSNPYEKVDVLMGNQGYVITEPERKTGNQQITPITLTDSKTDENTSQYDMNVSFDPVTGKMTISRTCTYTGLCKTKEIDERVRFTTYMMEDFKIFNGSSLAENLTGRALNEYYSSVQALNEEFKTAKPEQIERNLRNEYNHTAVYKNFRMISDGRSTKKNNLQVIEDFELNNMSRHAGKKILLNLTGLMGSQLQITGEERIRTKDIYLSYPRKLVWNINMKVPEGYLVKGLKELNNSVANEAGKFICEAKEENGIIKITVTKQYHQKNMPKEKWDQLLAFTDAAHDQTFKYILLQPK